MPATREDTLNLCRRLREIVLPDNIFARESRGLARGEAVESIERHTCHSD